MTGLSRKDTKLTEFSSKDKKPDYRYSQFTEGADTPRTKGNELSVNQSVASNLAPIASLSPRSGYKQDGGQESDR